MTKPEMEGVHEVRYLHGKRLLTSTCPSCRAEVLTLIREYRGGKVVRVYCHKCPPDPVDPVKTPLCGMGQHPVAVSPADAIRQVEDLQNRGGKNE